jgi:outer membrane immunogenic protein
MLHRVSLAAAIIACFVFSSGIAKAQGILSKSEVSVSAVVELQKFSSGNDIGQGSTNGGGFQVNYRYRFNRLFSAEADYARARDTQIYDGGGLGRIQTNINALTANFVVSVPIHPFGIRPYAFGGAGKILFRPTNQGLDVVPGQVSQNPFVIDYGGGLDYGFFPHLSVRGEYRGYIVNAPNFGIGILTTGSRTHIAQPSVGLVIHF